MKSSRVFATASVSTNTSKGKNEMESTPSNPSDSVIYSAMRLDTNVSVDSAFRPVHMELATSPSQRTIFESTGTSVSSRSARSDNISSGSILRTADQSPSKIALEAEVASILGAKSNASDRIPSPSLQHLKKRASSSAIKAREMLPLLPVLPPKPPCLKPKSFNMPMEEFSHAKRIWEKSDFYRRRVRAPIVPLVDYHAEKRRLGGVDPLTYPYNAFPRVPEFSGLPPIPPIVQAVQDNVQVWSINTTTVKAGTEMKKLLQRLDKKPHAKGYSAARRCAVCHYAPRKPDGDISSPSQTVVSPVSSTSKSLKTTSQLLILPVPSEPQVPLAPSVTSVTSTTSKIGTTQSTTGDLSMQKSSNLASGVTSSVVSISSIDSTASTSKVQLVSPKETGMYSVADSGTQTVEPTPTPSLISLNPQNEG